VGRQRRIERILTMELLKFIVLLAATTLTAIMGAVIALDGFLFRGTRVERVCGTAILLAVGAFLWLRYRRGLRL
jgi:hypothetical protein